jgi:hypothetical protein
VESGEIRDNPRLTGMIIKEFRIHDREGNRDSVEDLLKEEGRIQGIEFVLIIQHNPFLLTQLAI